MRKLFGYSDRISVRPGETIRFMVSSLNGSSYHADITRLICGDHSPAGPGFKETPVSTEINGDYPGRVQPIRDGSYVVVPHTPLFDSLSSFTLQAMIWPTTPKKPGQALLGSWCEEEQKGLWSLHRPGRRCGASHRRRERSCRDPQCRPGNDRSLGPVPWQPVSTRHLLSTDRGEPRPPGEFHFRRYR